MTTRFCFGFGCGWKGMHGKYAPHGDVPLPEY